MSSDLVFNPGSERNLISICLKDTDKILDIEAEDILPEHFSVTAHKYLYMAIMYLYSKKVKPTPYSIMEVITDDSAKKAIEDIGGLEYLITLGESEVGTDNLKIFSDKIKQSYTRKNIIKIAEESKLFALSEKAEVMNPSELIGHVEERLQSLSINTSTSNDVYKMGNDTERVLEERAKNPDTVPGLETGWHQFDRYTNGFQPGDLVIVVAEAKTGKSVTLTNWATKFSIIDTVPVLYIDTEMSSREQEDRVLSRLSGIPHNEIVNGMYVMDTVNGKASEKVAKLKVARQQLNVGNYYHIYMPSFTIEKVTTMVRKFQLQFGIGAMFFDYIKIPSSMASSTAKYQQEYQSLGYFTSGLKDIAGTLKIPVITAAQANRSNLGEVKKDASSIGGSYRILQLASKLMFLTNKTDEMIAKQGIANGNQVLQIAYQRNGESNCDPINIMFDKPKLHQWEV